MEVGERKYFPNLPFGEYRLKFLGAFICNESINYPISYNYHLSRISKTKTVLTGKLIQRIPFDDSLNLHISAAVLDNIGGWKSNAFIHRRPNACLSLKNIMGEAWIPFLQSFNESISGCPVKPGNYTLNGFDLSLLEKSNFPKQYFYGTYKLKIQATDKKDDPDSCLFIVSEVVRPWEYNV
ncbi:uncharacterized protein LOC126844837 [Adelges cooleyi]|uniref:uncharacterized protein LOC126844837 n=1 Tax=Adelges cooleyi TaxID=133065 RepID=UPI00217F3548|nr:uncharacterized protein LOC126844837 [Adelges cooleyi]